MNADRTDELTFELISHRFTLGSNDTNPDSVWAETTTLALRWNNLEGAILPLGLIISTMIFYIAISK